MPISFFEGIPEDQRDEVTKRQHGAALLRARRRRPRSRGDIAAAQRGGSARAGHRRRSRRAPLPAPAPDLRRAGDGRAPRRLRQAAGPLRPGLRAEPFAAGAPASAAVAVAARAASCSGSAARGGGAGSATDRDRLGDAARDGVSPSADAITTSSSSELLTVAVHARLEPGGAQVVEQLLGLVLEAQDPRPSRRPRSRPAASRCSRSLEHDRVAVRAGLRVADRGHHPLLEHRRHRVLEPLGLLVDLVPGDPQDVGEEALDQPVALDDRLGVLEAVVGEAERLVVGAGDVAVVDRAGRSSRGRSAARAASPARRWPPSSAARPPAARRAPGGTPPRRRSRVRCSSSESIRRWQLGGRTRALITGASKGHRPGARDRARPPRRAARPDRARARRPGGPGGRAAAASPSCCPPTSPIAAPSRRPSPSSSPTAGGLDLLVANAGLAHYGPVRRHARRADSRRWSGSTSSATVLTVKAGLDAMIDRGRGHIVVVASGAALRSFPGAAVYGGTKAADAGFAQALRHELSGHRHQPDHRLPGRGRHRPALPPARAAARLAARRRGDRARAGRRGDARRGRGRTSASVYVPGASGCSA